MVELNFNGFLVAQALFQTLPGLSKFLGACAGVAGCPLALRLFGPVAGGVATAAAITADQSALFHVKHLGLIEYPLMVAVPAQGVALVALTGGDLFEW